MIKFLSRKNNEYKITTTKEEHHKKKTFKDEYLDFLQRFEIEYDEKYVFEWIE